MEHQVWGLGGRHWDIQAYFPSHTHYIQCVCVCVTECEWKVHWREQQQHADPSNRQAGVQRPEHPTIHAKCKRTEGACLWNNQHTTRARDSNPLGSAAAGCHWVQGPSPRAPRAHSTPQQGPTREALDSSRSPGPTRSVLHFTSSNNIKIIFDVCWKLPSTTEADGNQTLITYIWISQSF